MGQVAPLTTMTYEREGRVARIVLDRPERGNGMAMSHHDDDIVPESELHLSVERVSDPRERVVVRGMGKEASALDDLCREFLQDLADS